MPLSKAKDRERKHKERAKIRLDKQLLSLAERKPVQPKSPNFVDSCQRSLDADGNPIYEEG